MIYVVLDVIMDLMTRSTRLEGPGERPSAEHDLMAFRGTICLQTTLRKMFQLGC
jgi:hypothetical protein